MEDLRLAVAQCLEDDSGQDILEYALVIAFLALAAVASLRGVGARVVANLNAISAALNSGI